MIKLIISLSLLGCFCAPAMGVTGKGLENLKAIVIQAGPHTEFYNGVQNDSSGGLRKFDLAPTIGVGMHLPMESGWHFLPELNWVLPQAAGSSQIIKNLIMIRADFGYDLLTWLRLRLGSSLMWQNMHGRGGKTSINNGNSESTFYYPDENRSSLNNTLDLGAEILFSEEWSLRLQTYTYTLFKKETRQLSYTVFVSYYWGL